MVLAFKTLEPRDGELVIEGEYPTCHDRWELTRPKDVVTPPSRYAVICAENLTEGYIEL